MAMMLFPNFILKLFLLVLLPPNQHSNRKTRVKFPVKQTMNKHYDNMEKNLPILRQMIHWVEQPLVMFILVSVIQVKDKQVPS